jgi:hypothetical protein
MPNVILKYESGAISISLIKKITEALPKIVANALNVETREDAKLTEEDVAVEVKTHGHMDQNTVILEITVIANDFPERKATLKERTDEIVTAIKTLIGNEEQIERLQGNAFVWIMLVPASFQMF